ncbi:hypothetical protein [Microbulbifer epialgicus]|uniref:Uncharacterized protein n=1 Tax=Microbulbifer epialgicus TaxID=393907 RepID=A0ABV4NXT1_9GAMM
MTLILAGASGLAAEVESPEEDFLLFLGEWTDDQGDVLVPEESDLWLEKPQGEVRRWRRVDEGGETREGQRDE